MEKPPVSCAKDCSMVLQRACKALDGWGLWYDICVSEQPWGNLALTMEFLASLQVHPSQVL